jgi:plasmid stabilization system protein ParE
MVYRLEVTLRARDDLDSLAEWISHDNLDAADRLFDRVGEMVLTLVGFRSLGARKSHSREPTRELRRIPIPAYPDLLLVYEVSQKTETVILHRVLHGRRNLASLE